MMDWHEVRRDSVRNEFMRVPNAPPSSPPNAGFIAYDFLDEWKITPGETARAIADAAMDAAVALDRAAARQRRTIGACLLAMALCAIVAQWSIWLYLLALVPSCFAMAALQDGDRERCRAKNARRFASDVERYARAATDRDTRT